MTASHPRSGDERARVAGPALALALVVLVGIGGVYAVGVQLDESDPNEDLTVEYNVTNVGGGTANGTVSLNVSGAGVADSETTRQLGTLDFDTGTLVYEDVATDFDAGDTVSFSVEIDQSADSLDNSATVTDGTPPSGGSVSGFAVAIDDTTSPITAGTNVTVTATVTNTGNSTDTQTITASADGISNATSVTLDPDNETTVTLSVGGLSPADRYAATVSSADDSDTVPVLVTNSSASAQLEVVSVDHPDTLNATSEAGALVTDGVDSAVTVLVPTVFVVAGVGVIGFVIAAIRPLRGGQGGGR